MKLSDRKFFASQALYGLMLTSKTQPQILAPEARLAMCQAAYDWADDMESIGNKEPEPAQVLEYKPPYCK